MEVGYRRRFPLPIGGVVWGEGTVSFPRFFFQFLGPRTAYFGAFSCPSYKHIIDENFKVFFVFSLS